MFLSRLAQPGVSQTSNGGLENGMHPPAVSWGMVVVCLYLDMLLFSSPLSHHLVGRNLSLMSGQETRGTRFLVCLCVGSTPVYISIGNWIPRTRYLSTGGTAAKVCTCVHWRGISCRRLSRARVTRVSCTQVYLIEGSVGRSPCVVRSFNDGGQIRPLPAVN